MITFQNSFGNFEIGHETYSILTCVATPPQNAGFFLVPNKHKAMIFSVSKNNNNSDFAFFVFERT